MAVHSQCLALPRIPLTSLLSLVVAQWLSKLQDMLPAAHPVSGRTEANLQNNMYLPNKARCRGMFTNREGRYLGTQCASPARQCRDTSTCVFPSSPRAHADSVKPVTITFSC